MPRAFQLVLCLNDWMHSMQPYLWVRVKVLMEDLWRLAVFSGRGCLKSHKASSCWLIRLYCLSENKSQGLNVSISAKEASPAVFKWLPMCKHFCFGLWAAASWSSPKAATKFLSAGSQDRAGVSPFLLSEGNCENQHKIQGAFRLC